MVAITRISAVPLTARFADVYGGADAVPASILRPASHFATVPRTGQYATLVRVETEDGFEGIGEAWGLPLPGATAMWIERLIAPIVIGRDADDIEGIWHELVGYFARIGHTASIAMEAVSGLDIALWDVRAKRAGQSLADLLGRRRDRVPCYVSPIMFQDDVRGTRAQARAFVDEGFRAVKLKGGRGVERDIADAAAVREEVGSEVALLVDVNGAYKLPEASRLAEGLAPLDITWLEEPLPPTALRDMAELRRRSAVPIATGENEATIAAFEQLLAGGCADVVMPNITRAGGVTGCLAIAQLTATHGARFSLHGVGTGIMLNASLALLAALDQECLFEVNRFPNPLRDDLTRPAARPQDGALLVPTGPGLGLSVVDEVVARYGPAPEC